MSARVRGQMVSMNNGARREGPIMVNRVLCDSRQIKWSRKGLLGNTLWMVSKEFIINWKRLNRTHAKL